MPKNRRYGYKSAFIYLFHSIKPHKTWYILASAIALLLIVVNLLQATVTARLVNSSVTGDLKNVYFSLLGFVGILAGSIFLQYIKDISTAKLAANASSDIKRRVCGKLLHAQLGEIIKLHGGDTVSTINTDTAAVCDFIGGDLIRLFSQFTMAAGAFLYLVTMNPRLCFVTFLYTPVGMFFTLSLNKKMNRLYPLCANYRGDALSAAEQALSSVPIIKSFMMERQTEKRVRAHYEDVCRTEMQISVWNALLEPACATTSRIPQMLYLLYAGHLVMQGELTIGAFIAMFDLINYVIGPSVHFPFLLNSFNKSIASINRIRRTEALAQEECKPVSETSGAAPAICIEGLSFGYDPQRQLFKDFSFAHRGPGLVALCGESGCGKTTLLDICAGLYAPQEGSVQVFGGIGVVLQDATLFRATVMENIRLGNKGARDADVYNAAKLAGAESFIQALPDGYATMLGDGTADLSGGQKQRISLARVLISDAPVWLLDEPTSALDVETERIVLKTIKRMASTKLILVSAHRKALIDCADRAIFLKGGVPDAEVSKL